MWIVRVGDGDYSCERVVIPIRVRAVSPDRSGRRWTMMRGMGACAALCAVLAIANACGPTAQPKAREDHEEELLGPKIAEDFDEAEQRWRNDIADARWS